MSGNLTMRRIPNPSGVTPSQMQVIATTTGAVTRANRTSSTQRESAYRARQRNIRTAQRASGTINVMPRPFNGAGTGTINVGLG